MLVKYNFSFGQRNQIASDKSRMRIRLLQSSFIEKIMKINESIRWGEERNRKNINRNAINASERNSQSPTINVIDHKQ